MSITVSVVVPVVRDIDLLDATLRSVADQEHRDRQVIVAVGAEDARADGVLARHAGLVSNVVRVPLPNICRLVNRGLQAASASTQVMSWLEPGDALMPGALATVAEIFASASDVHWLTGQRAITDDRGAVTGRQPVRQLSHLRFLVGDHAGIAQEATFWSQELWQAAGARVDETYTEAFDIELWFRFFRYARLAPLEAVISARRASRLRMPADRRLRYLAQVERAAALARRNVPDAYAQQYVGPLTVPFWHKDQAEADVLDADIALDDPAPILFDRHAARYKVKDDASYIPGYSRLTARSTSGRNIKAT